LLIAKAERIVRDFTSFDTEAKNLLQLISQLHTSRVSGYGYTAEAEILGVEYYAINEQLDVRTCPVCEMMHGRVFPVSEARRLLDDILFEEDPEIIKTKQPWPSQKQAAVASMQLMSPEELIGKGWHIPPFHPWCRGILVHVKDVPDKIMPVEVAALQEVLSSPVHAGRPIEVTDFEALKQISTLDFSIQNPNGKIPELRPEHLATWNKVMGDVTPAALYNVVNNGFKGALAVNGGEFTLSIGGDNILMSARMWDDVKGTVGRSILAHLERTFVRERDGVLNVEHDYFKIANRHARSGYGKNFMSESFRLYEEMGVEAVDVDANIEVGAYAWAKYGFKPKNLKVSKALSDNLRTTLRAMSWRLSPDVVDAVQEVITKIQTDPTALWVLSDIGFITEGEPLAKSLLYRKSWLGTIRLDDDVAMNRLWAYVGRPENVK